MVSTEQNRGAFISSLIEFMDEYGFTGADIDWEYPSNPQRGGKKEDKDNLVELMKDMKAAFGFRYGVSVVLAPDYWYLQGFSPAAMEQYVDHLGFMAYDLHGSWDSENALGSLMRPHTDIRDIDNGLTPLWFDGVISASSSLAIAAIQSGDARAGIFAPIVDGYRRVFHPQIGGHMMIADLVIARMVLDRKIESGYDNYKFDEKACQFPTTPSNPTPSAPENALNIILESRIWYRPDGWGEVVFKWLFYSVPCGTGSECSTNPGPIAQAPGGVTPGPKWPAGTFNIQTQDGVCQYKNDGNDNPGALWCGSTVHSCKAHAHKSQALGAAMSCGDKFPLGDGEKSVNHRSWVVCEW